MQQSSLIIEPQHCDKDIIRDAVNNQIEVLNRMIKTVWRKHTKNIATRDAKIINIHRVGLSLMHNHGSPMVLKNNLFMFDDESFENFYLAVQSQGVKIIGL